MLKFILKNQFFGGWLWLLPDSLQNRAEMLHEEWLEFCFKAVKERHESLKVVKKEVREWAESPEFEEFSKKARMRYLRCQLRSATAEFELIREKVIEMKYEGLETGDQTKKAEGLVKKIKGYQASIDFLDGKIEMYHIVTDEMVERAREYPLENLVEFGMNRRAKCVFHQGEDYNMDIRKNFAYCFVCGEHSDVIGVYRKLHECGFREAVIALQ